MKRTLVALATLALLAHPSASVAGPAERPAPDPVTDPIVAAAVPDIAHPDLLPSRTSLMGTVRDLVAMAPRATGTKGGRQTAAYVARRFREAGLSDVHYETAKSFHWSSDGGKLQVGGKRFAATPIQHSLIVDATKPSHRTLGTKGLTAEVVDIGSSLVVPPSVKGKIVLFDLKFLMPLAALATAMEFLWDPDLQVVDPATLLTANPYMTSYATVMKEIVDAGAVGAIGVLSDYFDSDNYHNESYRQVQMTIPGFWVAPKTGAALRAALEKSPRATMHLTTDRRRATARTVVGFLPGKTNDVVMVQSHHDSQGPGAVEDGTGAASVVGLADYYGALARRPDYVKPDKTLMFATFDTHFTGYQQHAAFAQKYVIDPATKYRIVAVAAIEHIGKQAKIGPNGKLKVLDQPEPSGIFENLNPQLKSVVAGALVRNDLRATAVLNASALQAGVGIPTDANWALLSQLPVASLIAGPMYMYDDADTLDKVDAARMRPMAYAYAQIIDAMEATPSDQIGIMPVAVADAIRAALVELLL